MDILNFLIKVCRRLSCYIVHVSEKMYLFICLASYITLLWIPNIEICCGLASKIELTYYSAQTSLDNDILSALKCDTLNISQCHKYVWLENLIPFEILFTYLSEPANDLSLLYMLYKILVWESGHCKSLEKDAIEKRVTEDYFIYFKVAVTFFYSLER